MVQSKIVPEEKDMPRKWYKIQASLGSPLPPPLRPGTGHLVGAEDLAPIFLSR